MHYNEAVAELSAMVGMDNPTGTNSPTTEIHQKPK
jgi:hypothetical protein